MNGRKAKAIRRQVYGDHSFRARRYFQVKATGQVIADARRQQYQGEKNASQK